MNLDDSNCFPADLITAFTNKQVVLFVGAGMSMNSDLPGWFDLVAPLAAEIDHPLPDEQWITGEHLTNAVQDYVNIKGARGLVQFLQEQLTTAGKTSSLAHRYLAQLPVELVFTANYDDLLERAYGDVGRSFQPVIDDRDVTLNLRDVPGVQVVKLYGDLERPQTIVLTKEKYERFFLDRPNMVALLEAELARSVMMYIGWSHTDIYYNVVFGGILSRLGERMRSGYTVMFDVTAAEHREFERKNIRVIELDKSPGYQPAVTTWLGRLLAKVEAAASDQAPAGSSAKGDSRQGE